MNSGNKKQRLNNKKPSHRNAILQSQLIELIRAEKVKTTVTKAKYLKANFDNLMTIAKPNDEASKRKVLALLQNDKAVTKVFGNLVPRLKDISSGYTNSALTLARKGDAAPQMIVMIQGAEPKTAQSRLSKLLTKNTKEPKAKKEAKTS